MVDVRRGINMEVIVMRNNLRVINGGMSNEEYAARRQRKIDLANWGAPDTWDEETLTNIVCYADEDELKRFLAYIGEDEEEVAPQLYAVNSDDDVDAFLASLDEEDDVYDEDDDASLDEIYDELPEVVKNLFINTDCTLTEVDHMESNPKAVGMFIHNDITHYYAIEIIRGEFNCSKESIVYHEFGHLLDYGYNECYKSNSKIFREIYEAEKGAFVVDDNYEYVTKDPQEYFAESFAEYMTNPDRLRDNTPMTYDYIEHVLKLTSIEELMYEKQIAKNKRFRETVNSIEELTVKEALKFIIDYRKEMAKGIYNAVKRGIKRLFGAK